MNPEPRKPPLNDGCRVHPHCLSCPLPQCIHDAPLAKVMGKAAERHAEIVRLVQIAGKNQTRLALGVSLRTVERALKAERARWTS